MTELILIIICLCFLISFFFAGGGVGSIAVCVICVGLLLARLIFTKKIQLEKKKFFLIHIVCFALAGSCIVFEEGSVSEHIVTDYSNGLEQTIKLLKKEKPEETYEILAAMKDEYGETEAILLTEIAALIDEGQYEEALKAVEKYPDKHCSEYYTVLETIYLVMDTEGEEALKEMYLQAANDCPDWLDMQIQAGIVQLERENYRSAEYYFLRAYEIDENNGMALYFQGIAQYELREYSKCLNCFAKAYEAGVEDFVVVSMQEYMQKILEEV